MLSSTRRTSRLLIAAVTATVVTFLGAAPAMAATSNVSVGGNNALFYDAAAGQLNQLTISGEASSLTVTDTGTDAIAPGTGCAATADPQSVTCGSSVDPEVLINQIEVKVRDLDDTVTLSTDLISLIYGQNGSDHLNGGPGPDVIRGGVGDDFLSGNDGNDTLIGEDGDDQLLGGSGSDTADFAAGTGANIDLSNSIGPQPTGAGMDTLTAIENVNGSTTGSDVLAGDGGPNKLIGSGGDDIFYVAGGGSDVVVCGDGSDEVNLDRSDVVRFHLHPDVGTTCETVDDGLPPSNTTITAGPSGPTNEPMWEYTSDEPWAGFECAVVENADDLGAAATTWSPCRSGQTILPPTDGTWVFAVRAVDDQGNIDTWDTRGFTLDTVAPDTDVQGPSGTTSNPAPEFALASPDDPDATFVCGFDREAFFECTSPVHPDPPLGDGDHFLEVAAIDAVGNRDATPARISFRVDTAPRPGPGDGPVPNPQPPAPPQVQQAKIIIGSLVLISGRTVRMSRKGRVAMSLTCAGAARCRGRLTITTAEPVRKRRHKLVTLGRRKFSIGANKKRRVRVRFSKRKRRLARRLKRFKAKAVIREVDARGNPRLSSRVFVLRAR